MRFRTVAAVTLSVPLALTALAGPTAGASPAARDAAPFGAAMPANVVILVDESGSMATYPGELPGERQAVAEIANAAWAKDSQVAVYGFGSAPPGEAKSTAVAKICGLTPVTTPQDIATLDGCASRIKVRPPGADNTDFDEALTVAGQVLAAQGTAAQGRVPLIFMLTDGTLDLGSQPATNAAQQQLSGFVLPSLAAQQIEIWPVGFGAADLSALNAIAAGGSQAIQSCPPNTGGTPRATTVPSTVTGQQETEQIQQQLLGAFAAASCATTEPGQWQILPPGKSLTQDVTVDPLTTLGSIVVNKGNQAVTVTYADPDSGRVSDAATTPPAGQLDGAAYELSSSGPTATQEALRLDYPVPGRWAVTFHNPTPQPQLIGTQVLWQGQIYPDINFKPTTGDSGSKLQIFVKPALDARPIAVADLTRLHLTVTVQWGSGQASQSVPTIFDKADGQFVGVVTVPARQSNTALVTAIVQADGVTGAATATLSYQPAGGLGVTVTIPPGTKVSPDGTLTAQAAISNLDNAKQPVSSIQFLLSGLGGSGNAWITQSPVSVGSGTGSVPVIIHVGSTRGPVQGVIDWEVVGTTVQHPAGFLNIDVEPPPPWYTQWWPWTALAVVVLGGTGLYARRRIAKGRALEAGEAAQRAAEECQRAEEERQAANMSLRDAGLAVLRRDGASDAAYLRWSKEEDVRERWFEVRRKARDFPLLVETTRAESGQLLLTRSAQDGTFRLTAPGVPAPAGPTTSDATGDGSAASAGSADPGPGGSDEVTPVAASSGIKEDRPFDPPPGTSLEDCVFMVTRGDAIRATLPDPRMKEQYDEDSVPLNVTGGHRWRDEEFERPEQTAFDNYEEYDGYDGHGTADGSGA